MAAGMARTAMATPRPTAAVPASAAARPAGMAVTAEGAAGAGMAGSEAEVGHRHRRLPDVFPGKLCRISLLSIENLLGCRLMVLITRSAGAGGSRGRDDINSIQLAQQDFSNLPPFEKNFYVEHPAVTARSPADVETYRKLREIHVQGSGVPKPCTTFEEASFPGMRAVRIHEHVAATLHAFIQSHGTWEAFIAAGGCTQGGL